MTAMEKGGQQPDGQPAQGLSLTKLDRVINWARKSSLWPLSVGLGCVGAELMALSATRPEFARFGAEAAGISPRHADLLIISGRVSWKMVPVIQSLYEQMPSPKWVMALGAGSGSGGVENNYAMVPDISKIIPVDVYVPGSPPGPEQLRHAISLLQQKIQNETCTFRNVSNRI